MILRNLYTKSQKKGKFAVDHNSKRKFMSAILTKKETIDEIVKEARKLDKMDLQILLAKLRVKKLVSEKRKPVANYDSKKIKAPTMEEIDTWKHEARKYNANK